MIYGLFGDACIHCKIKPSVKARLLLMAPWGDTKQQIPPALTPNTTPDSPDLRVQLYG